MKNPNVLLIVISAAIIFVFATYVLMLLNNRTERETKINNHSTKLRIERIDGCEYVLFGFHDIAGVTHHGVCDNPEHK